jgi:diguanylate cyclase (GGDEF)-like protein/PAS domain S-box-containing protein
MKESNDLIMGISNSPSDPSLKEPLKGERDIDADKSNSKRSEVSSLNVLNNCIIQSQDLGIVVLNQQQKVCLWNRWIEEKTNTTEQQALGKMLTEIFISFKSPRLESAITNAVKNGLSSILSQVFNPYPLPLFMDEKTRKNNKRIHQQINVRHTRVEDVSYAIVEVRNVTATVIKEQLLKRQTASLRKANEQFLQQENYTQSILDSSSEAILTLSNDGRVLSFNRAVKSIFQLADQDLTGQMLSQFVPAFIPSEFHHYNEPQILGGLTSKNRKIELDILCNPLTNDNGVFVVTMRDITEQQSMKAAVFRSDKLARTALNSIADGVVTTDQFGVIDLLNPIASDLLNRKNNELIGEVIGDVFQLLNEQADQSATCLVSLAIKQKETIYSSDESVLKNLVGKDSDFLPVMASASPILDQDDKVTGCVLVFRDVKESRQLSNQLTWEASHDALTGLHNRKSFNEKLDSLILHSTPSALLFMDLDRFKLVNDTAGHAIGDELLKQVSLIFCRHFRDGDFVSRLGGDEFAVLLQGCPLEKARSLAQDLCVTLEHHTVPWKDRVFTVGVSIGLTMVLSDDVSMSKVIERADAACYSAKKSGRSRVHVYGESDEETQYQANVERASQISEAISKKRFVLYKQPIVSIAGNERKLHHYEILIRMLGENNEIIPPNDFIPAAEQFGLMQLVDRHVITKVVDYIKINRNKEKTFSFAINLSGASIIDEMFSNFLDNIIKRETILPSDIHFEITETAAISNLGVARKFIDHFHQLGFSFALDDFGSGMSSFGYLKNLPLDYIKIDGQFIKEIIGNETDFAMVSSINYLGHMMGLKCIAEFVENDEIMVILDKIGVDYAQGYGIERPTPLFEEDDLS